jgi:hypothetical protein
LDGGDGRVSDLGLARAIAAAVRTVPGVAELSPGRFAEVATYGAGDRVSGVIPQAGGGCSGRGGAYLRPHTSCEVPRIATRVRAATRQSLEAAGVTLISRIDVAFDDVRVK